MEIREISQDEWQEYKTLRLKALQEVPQAFGSSFDEEKDYSEEEWRGKIGSSNNFFGTKIFAFEDGRAVGMIGAYQEMLEKVKHTANITSFYVDEDFRGRGIGNQLIERILSEIGSSQKILKVMLFVNVSQAAAVSLYQKYGFRIIGTQRNALKVGDHFYDEHIMELMLNSNC